MRLPCIEFEVSAPLTVAQSWLWDSKVAFNKTLCQGSTLSDCFGQKWPVLAAKYHALQKIIHNPVKTYDILIKYKVLESL